jgi:thiamine biosynthesis lipoprotein
VEEIEAATSNYRDASDLSQLNQVAGGEPMPVQRDLWVPLRRALEFAKETEGAFDPTIGPLVALWKRTWKKGQAPRPEETAAAEALVDYRNVRLLDSPPRAQLLKRGMELDLGRIGKGYAADEAVACLRQRGIQAALVAAAGDIVAAGAPPERDWWLVGIADPAHPDKLLPKVLRLHDQAVSTSGDYVQFGTVEGQRRSHIMDPRTGQPVLHMSSVTVVGKNGTTTDAFGTALSVLGPEAAIAFAEKRGDLQVMVICERDGRTETFRSQSFAALEVTPEAPR